jgi:hypothetical protein
MVGNTVFKAELLCTFPLGFLCIFLSMHANATGVISVTSRGMVNETSAQLETFKSLEKVCNKF